uniref:Type IV pilus biogenesis n=1 Tax=Candidatus Kentrum sp. LPFa TaxID=2126335 RepID=A0A450WSB2_9GAMM|nr:MAG: Type IV pilus biogenesis [Candidatus Kentron sp. LPFa]
MPKTRYHKTLHRLLPAFASIPLLGGIGYTVMDRFYDVSTDLPHHEGDATTKARPEDRPSPTIKTIRATRDIAGLHLFGEIPKVAPELVPISIAPLESTLDMALHGIIAAAEKGKSLAIIADAKGKQDAYAVGAALSEGIILQEVNDDHVLLRNGNRLETLRMWDASRDKPQEGSSGEFLATGGGLGPMMPGTSNRGGRAPRSYHNRRPRRSRSPSPTGYPAASP